MQPPYLVRLPQKPGYLSVGLGLQGVGAGGGGKLFHFTLKCDWDRLTGPTSIYPLLPMAFESDEPVDAQPDKSQMTTMLTKASRRILIVESLTINRR